jgi:hypothetical protein
MTTGWNLAPLAVAAFAAVALIPARADDLPPLKPPNPSICTSDPAGDPSHPTQKCASLEDWRTYVEELCLRVQADPAPNVIGSAKCFAARLTLDKVEMFRKNQLAAYDRAVVAREKLARLQSGNPVPPDTPPPPDPRYQSVYKQISTDLTCASQMCLPLDGWRKLVARECAPTTDPKAANACSAAQWGLTSALSKANSYGFGWFTDREEPRWYAEARKRSQ